MVAPVAPVVGKTVDVAVETVEVAMPEDVPEVEGDVVDTEASFVELPTVMEEDGAVVAVILLGWVDCVAEGRGVASELTAPSVLLVEREEDAVVVVVAFASELVSSPQPHSNRRKARRQQKSLFTEFTFSRRGSNFQNFLELFDSLVVRIEFNHVITQVFVAQLRFDSQQAIYLILVRGVFAENGSH